MARRLSAPLVSGSRFAVAALFGAALMSTAAHAQTFTYSYFPANATISTPLTTDFAIVGFSGGRYNEDTFAREFTGPSSPTVTIADGADIADAEIFNSSIVNMTGGSAALFPYDHSTVNVHGGSVSFAVGFESSVFNIHGGVLDDLEGQCQRINVFGGTIGTLVANTQTEQSGNAIGICTVDVFGGTITTEINAFNGGILNFRGGQILAPIIRALDGSTINIYGSGLTSQLIDPDFNSGFARYSIYSITGFLADGSALSDLRLRIKNDGSSSFTLNNVPSPGTASLLAMGGLLAARRRRAAR